MKKRNVALCVIFSIVTFGIYGLYWMAQINNCANELADPPKKTGGGVAVLLTIVTLGITRPWEQPLPRDSSAS